MQKSYNGHISKTDRSLIKHQKPCVIWMTGLSGAGKSSIANELEIALHQRSLHTYILDGDSIRQGLNKDLNYQDRERQENIRRISELSKLMLDAGLIVITACISPFQKDRDEARNRIPHDEFIEVFVDTPIALCEQRDPKGLYQKARAGHIKNFTGISSPYEPPKTPEIHLKAYDKTPHQAAQEIIEYLVKTERLFIGLTQVKV